jgi:hypothetical protein
MFSNLAAFKTSIQNTRDNLKEFSRIGVNAARIFEKLQGIQQKTNSVIVMAKIPL